MNGNNVKKKNEKLVNLTYVNHHREIVTIVHDNIQVADRELDLEGISCFFSIDLRFKKVPFSRSPTPRRPRRRSSSTSSSSSSTSSSSRSSRRASNSRGRRQSSPAKARSPTPEFLRQRFRRDHQRRPSTSSSSSSSSSSSKSDRSSSRRRRN